VNRAAGACWHLSVTPADNPTNQQRGNRSQSEPHGNTQPDPDCLNHKTNPQE